MVVFLLSLLHRDRWTEEHFRRLFLTSLLVFVVIFNHQAERPSYIIAATGVAIWYADSSREPYRLLLLLFSLTGLRALGYLPIWIVMQLELHRVPMPWFARARTAGRLSVSVEDAGTETHVLASAVVAGVEPFSAP